MANPDSLTRRLHRCSLITFFLLIVMIPCAAVSANAQQDAGSKVSPQDGEAHGALDAVVTDVQGNTIALEGGILIDISQARVFTYTEGLLDRSLIKPGMTIRVRVTSPGDASAALVAETIRIRVPNEIVLTGMLQDADVLVDEYRNVQGGFITLLNRRLPVGPLNTGVKPKQLRAGRTVSVVLITSGTDVSVKSIFLDIPLTLVFP